MPRGQERPIRYAWAELPDGRMVVVAWPAGAPGMAEGDTILIRLARSRTGESTPVAG